MTKQSNQKHEAKLLKVFLKYQGVLGRLVGRIVRPHEIEDIVQETFVRAYETQLKLDIEHPKSYLYYTARNLAFNHIKKKSNLQDQAIGDFDPSSVIDNTGTLESQVEAKEKFRFFCQAVSLLPAQCQRAFILKRVYGLSQKEIAAYMDISERTVEGHIAKGVVRCAQYLKDHGYQAVANDKQKGKGKHQHND